MFRFKFLENISELQHKLGCTEIKLDYVDEEVRVLKKQIKALCKLLNVEIIYSPKVIEYVAVKKTRGNKS